MENRPERTSLLLNLRPLLASHPLEFFWNGKGKSLLFYLLYTMSVAQDRQNAACIGQLSVYLFEKKREEKDDKQATVSSEMKENSCSADRQKKAWVS